MNKQEIEKRYDEIFGEKHYTICEGKKCECHKEVKKFIFNEILPEVLQSVLPEKQPINIKDSIERVYNKGENLCRERVKRKAKKLYNIKL